MENMGEQSSEGRSESCLRRTVRLVRLREVMSAILVAVATPACGGYETTCRDGIVQPFLLPWARGREGAQRGVIEDSNKRARTHTSDEGWLQTWALRTADCVSERRVLRIGESRSFLSRCLTIYYTQARPSSKRGFLALAYGVASSEELGWWRRTMCITFYSHWKRGSLAPVRSWLVKERSVAAGGLFFSALCCVWRFVLLGIMALMTLWPYFGRYAHTAALPTSRNVLECILLMRTNSGTHTCCAVLSGCTVI